jgi:hypothetical protein
MIVPTKYVPAPESTLGLACTLLVMRDGNQTISELWLAFRAAHPSSTFDRFVEALTLLYLLGVVEIDEGTLLWGTAA